MRRLHIIRNVNRMSKISFRMISLGLFVFSSSLCALAVKLCQEAGAGATDLMYRYPPMLEAITYPIIVLIAVALIIDVNEKQRDKK